MREVRPFASGARVVVETPAPMVALAPWGSASVPCSPGDDVVVAFDIAAAHLIADEC